jgi:hypothetical protein
MTAQRHSGDYPYAAQTDFISALQAVRTRFPHSHNQPAIVDTNLKEIASLYWLPFVASKRRQIIAQPDGIRSLVERSLGHSSFEF